jgi:hypothetical protein
MATAHLFRDALRELELIAFERSKDKAQLASLEALLCESQQANKFLHRRLEEERAKVQQLQQAGNGRALVHVLPPFSTLAAAAAAGVPSLPPRPTEAVEAEEASEGPEDALVVEPALSAPAAPCPSEERPFHCPECSGAFALMRGLKAHMRLSHSNEEFKCDQCPQLFKSKAAKGAHARCHFPKKSEVAVEPDPFLMPEDLIAKRVRIFWPQFKRWYDGRVKAVVGTKHIVTYDDGDDDYEEELLGNGFPKRGWRLLVPAVSV